MHTNAQETSHGAYVHAPMLGVYYRDQGGQHHCHQAMIREQLHSGGSVSLTVALEMIS